MGITNSLQNGRKTAQIQTNANVAINTGNGHSNIKVTAKNSTIDTGCGNQDINVAVSENLSIDTGFCGEDKIKANVGGNAKIVTREDNDIINLKVDGNFYVDAGMVHPECGAESDDDIVFISGNVNNFSGQNYVSTGQGNDNVRISANNVNIEKADGELTLGFFGDNYNVNSKADNNTIGFWGDDININITGNGYNDIETLDFAMEDGKFTDFDFQKLIDEDSYVGTTTEVEIKEELTANSNIDKIAKKYNLSDAQKEMLENIDYDNLNTKLVLYKSGKEYKIGISSNDNVYDAVKGNLLTKTEVSQSTKITKKKKKKWYGKKTTKYYAKTTTTTKDTDYKKQDTINLHKEKKITTTTTTTDYYTYNGANNVSINMSGNSNYNIELTSNEGKVNIDASENNGDGNINIRSGYSIDKTNVDVDVKYTTQDYELDVGKLETKTSSTTTKKYLGKKTSWSGWAKNVMKGIVSVASIASAFIPVAGAFIAPAIAAIGNTLVDYETQTVLPGQKKSMNSVYKNAASVATSALSYIPVVGSALETAADIGIEYGIKDK